MQESRDTWKSEKRKLVKAFTRLNTTIQQKKTEGSDFFVLEQYNILTRYEPPKNNNNNANDTDDSFMDVDDNDDDFEDIDDDDETDDKVRVFYSSF